MLGKDIIDGGLTRRWLLIGLIEELKLSHKADLIKME